MWIEIVLGSWAMGAAILVLWFSRWRAAAAVSRASLPPPIVMVVTECCTGMMKLVIKSEGHTYLVTFRPCQVDLMVQTLARWGTDPAIPLTPRQTIEIGKVMRTVARRSPIAVPSNP